jgi:hypothetical protein
VKDNTTAIAGAFLVAILGWALTTIVGSMNYEREELDAVQQRVAILETILEDHKDTKHKQGQ